MSKLSPGYYQLAGVFESLEKGDFESGIHFGANIAGCFRWYLSPIALKFLEENAVVQWEKLKSNSQFTCVPEHWEGYPGKGMDIRLIY